ncbi:hypothetical protein MRX96_003991 [Rhipicephalus microplus]
MREDKRNEEASGCLFTLRAAIERRCNGKCIERILVADLRGRLKAAATRGKKTKKTPGHPPMWRREEGARLIDLVQARERSALELNRRGNNFTPQKQQRQPQNKTPRRRAK